MSRALDKDVLRSLQSGDSAAVYQDISQLLTVPPGSGRLEIELLGSSHPLEPGTHFLRDGNAVAIPKLRLVQAFFVARQILTSYLTNSDPSLSDTAVRAATGVILLMDPEHLTAANTRKRLLNDSLIKNCKAAEWLESEELLIDSFLTSHLHRHTKSPTLWSHRRWLLEVSKSRLVDPSRLIMDLKEVVIIAAERHPRNYYAWDHARWLVNRMGSGQWNGAGQRVVDMVKEWCFRNRTDTSGWSFLLFLVTRREPEARAATVFAETLKLALSLRWTNESAWVFLRTLAGSGLIGDCEHRTFQDVAESLKSTASQESIAVLESAICWPAQSRTDRIGS